MGKTGRLLILVYAAAAISGGASAARAESASSSGGPRATVSIIASVAAKAKVSAPTELSALDLNADERSTSVQRLILRTNTRTGYTFSALGSGRSARFILSAPSRPDVPYVLSWHDTVAGPAETQLAAPGRGFAMAQATSGWSDPLILTFDVKVSNQAMLQRAGGPFKGALTLIAAPN